MTDTELENVQVEETVAAPKPKRRPASASRAKPNGPGDDLAAQNATLLERIERLERNNTMQFIPSEPPPTPKARIADPEELTPFQRELRAVTHPTPKDWVPATKNYNFPKRWFARPDGDIVQLQGDPVNQAMYIDLGFHLLSPDEERRWIATERRKVLKVQQRRAQLVGQLQNEREMDPMLKLNLPPQIELDWSRMSVTELEDQVAIIKRMPTSDGRPRIQLQRLKRFQDADDLAAQAETDRMLAGVEVGGTDRDFRRFHPESEGAEGATHRDIEITHSSRPFI